MGYRIHLKPDESLALPRKAVRSLIKKGDGDGALLYLYLAENGGQDDEAAICRTLHWTAQQLSAAEETLAALGLLGEKQAHVDPLPAAPERECPEYSRRDLLTALEGNSEFSMLRAEVGEKLNKILTEKDDALLFGLYDFLGLPADVIFLLVGHCIERTERKYGANRRPTLRQIEKEGYAWARRGLMTQELAVEYLCDYARRQSAIPAMMTALHLGDRPPVAKEQEFLMQWSEWGFHADALEYAYEKTVFKCGRMDWKYCNGILRNLHQKGLHSAAEIAAQDHLPARPEGEKKKTARAAAADDAASVQESVAWMKEYLNHTGK